MVDYCRACGYSKNYAERNWHPNDIVEFIPLIAKTEHGDSVLFSRPLYVCPKCGMVIAEEPNIVGDRR